MPIYKAHFYTEADWAHTTIKAANPKLALRRARQIESKETETLSFRSYDTTDGIDLIEIETADRRTVATWQSDAWLLRLAAGDLLEALAEQTDAAQAVLDCWAHGNLARLIHGSSGN
jgi:hypothetical protein